MKSSVRLLSDVLLGRESGQRLSATMSLIAVATALLFALVQQGEVALGLLDQRASSHLTAAYVGGLTVFFLLIRLGISKRLSSDGGLLLPQAGFGIACLAWSYVIHERTRGAVLMIILFVIVYGMLSLTARRAAGLGVFAFLALCAGVAGKALLRPQTFEPKVELVHLGLLAATLAGTSLVSVRVNSMRRHLREQKRTLEDAMVKLSNLADRDGLTGLLNRRALLERVQTEAFRRSRVNSPLSLAIVDLDHFKRVNDEYGHQAGDAVLCSFAALAQGSVRGSDVLARWGGEEFMLVLPDTPSVDALAVLERIRQSLVTHTIAGVPAGHAVTFSAGISECAGVTDIDACVGRADEALYRAKHGGRNRSLVSTAPAPKQVIPAEPLAGRREATDGSAPEGVVRCP